MKRVVVTVAVLLCVTMMLTGADIRTLVKVKQKNPTKKYCGGYTIIEVDKGIDCDGDTVALTKEHGYYEVVSAHDRWAVVKANSTSGKR
jgi:hypothetical protein